MPEHPLIGRRTELDIFKHALANASGPQRILYIQGAGGLGKTLLLAGILRIAISEKNTIAAAELIDTYNTEHRHIDGLRQAIAKQIGLDHFEEFQRRDTPDSFLKCLQRLCIQNTVVLAFDTFEYVAEDAVGEWLLTTSDDGGLQMPGLICVIGGRIALQPNNLIKVLELKGFSLEEAIEFYTILDTSDPLGLLAENTDAEVQVENQTQRHSIQALVDKTDGTPLLLELAYTWLRQGMWDSSTIDQWSKDEFEQKLMEQPKFWGDSGMLDVGDVKLSYPMYQCLVCMAYLNRRFNRLIMQMLIDRKYIRLDEKPSTEVQIEGILKSLQQLFFIKTHPGSDVIQLHDELVRLFMNYLWPTWENANFRKDFQQSVLDIYDELIRQEQAI